MVLGREDCLVNLPYIIPIILQIFDLLPAFLGQLIELLLGIPGLVVLVDDDLGPSDTMLLVYLSEK